jgi:hypothetical protein
MDACRDRTGLPGAGAAPAPWQWVWVTAPLGLLVWLPSNLRILDLPPGPR